MPRSLLTLAFVLPMLATAQPVQAQTQRCAPRAQMIDLLSSRQDETRRAIGLTANHTVMELYASERSGSWTLLVTLPNGLTCLVAAGNDFELTETEASGAPT